ncbi:23S rRNA (uracil1939-C5)-methyltransferase [Ruminococcaceae bacterium YRB3002]|nr:23S rRNA (uracil1939-C5)-methyltransferase [Ruminococcaceae bacterium YRB3002]
MTSCKSLGECGGCDYIGRPYEYQLGLKQSYINRLLEGICPVDNIVGCEEPYYYRNKVHAAYKRIRSRVICGTYSKGSHRIVEHGRCYIENRKAQEIIESIRDIAEKHKMSIYDERSNSGLLRRVLVRVSEATGQIMVVLVTGNKYFTGKRDFIADIISRHPEITTVLTSYNSRHDSMILGRKAVTEYGKGYIEDVILGKTFRISAESFLQVNSHQTDRLYSAVIELAAVGAEDNVLDCYCGIGTITLTMAPLCGHATGVEINPSAVADAKANARINRIKNVSFICRDATEFMLEAAGKGRGRRPSEGNDPIVSARELSEEEAERNKVPPVDVHYDLVIMDPPRAGSTSSFIRSVAKLAPEKVVYVSCNPETLVRDLKMFASHGYEAVRAIPVDMFPWTENIEVVSLLQRMSNTSKKTITFDVDMDIGK